MTDLEESQKITIEGLHKEIKVWKEKYFAQIKTDEEWESYIKQSREDAKKQSKQTVLFWILGLLWFLLVIYEFKQ
jgi:predicted Holliday junction resolvase-like endonuclease|tara:strand:+ start:984 stop:1208 length:225 start_codon:yes stop_codon:yes gene_type:complete